MINRLQTYLRQCAAQLYTAIPLPPFTIFVHPTESFIHNNYAIPDKLLSGDLAQTLSLLCEVFAGQDRTPRFEYIEQFAPDLASALEVAGFVLEMRSLLMVCAPDTFRLAPAVDGVTITPLAPDAPLSDIRALMMVQREGFSTKKSAPISDEEAATFRAWLGDTRFFLARYNGLPVSAGSLTPPIDGVAEVAGITTLAPYRRRGIGTAITAAATQTAFEQGVEIAMLTAGDEQAGRVYERVGFQAIGSGLAYVYPSVPTQNVSNA
jgi:GNAT superfamily N-acetyltransferase